MPLAPTGISPYIQTSERLEQLGHHRNPCESEKNHCKRFVDVIMAEASGHYKINGKVIVNQTKATPVRVFSSGANVASDEFLRSYEWRRVRMMALKKYGAVCQCCGASPATGAVMNVDHIKPRKLFPNLALDVSNLQILCHDCNHGKGNWDMTDWRGSAEEFERQAAAAMREMLQ